MDAKPLNQIVTFRITDSDERELQKIAKEQDWTKGHVLRRIFVAGLKALAKELSRG